MTPVGRALLGLARRGRRRIPPESLPVTAAGPPGSYPAVCRDPHDPAPRRGYARKPIDVTVSTTWLLEATTRVNKSVNGRGFRIRIGNQE